MMKSVSGKALTFRPYFPWPKRDGRAQITEAHFRCDDVSIFNLQYANSAEISRINKGLKRRANQTVFGFHIDPRSGYWAKSVMKTPMSMCRPMS
jgi:hypothetical protein